MSHLRPEARAASESIGNLPRRSAITPAAFHADQFVTAQPVVARAAPATSTISGGREFIETAPPNPANGNSRGAWCVGFFRARSDTERSLPGRDADRLAANRSELVKGEISPRDLTASPRCSAAQSALVRFRPDQLRCSRPLEGVRRRFRVQVQRLGLAYSARAGRSPGRGLTVSGSGFSPCWQLGLNSLLLPRFHRRNHPQRRAFARWQCPPRIASRSEVRCPACLCRDCCGCRSRQSTARCAILAPICSSHARRLRTVSGDISTVFSERGNADEANALYVDI